MKDYIRYLITLTVIFILAKFIGYELMTFGLAISIWWMVSENVKAENKS